MKRILALALGMALSLLWVANPGPAAAGLDGALVASIGRGPDGALWAATDRGVALLRDRAWSVVTDRPATMLAVAPDGTVWAAADTQELVRMAPGRNAGGGAAQLPVEVTTIACPIAVGILAVARDGTAYGGSSGYATESLGPCAFRRQRVHQATAGIYRRRPDAPPVPER